jgi:hypothetical protein
MLVVFSAVAGLASTRTFAQTSGTGAIEGRVQHSARGTYLNNARVTPS